MPSFDIVSEVDKHELMNAVDQANRELSNRFDFKGSDATFALDGPERCSGLPVCRYDAPAIVAELRRSGAELELIESRTEVHVTPWGSEQRFVYAVMRR